MGLDTFFLGTVRFVENEVEAGGPVGLGAPDLC